MMKATGASTSGMCFPIVSVFYFCLFLPVGF